MWFLNQVLLCVILPPFGIIQSWEWGRGNLMISRRLVPTGMINKQHYLIGLWSYQRTKAWLSLTQSVYYYKMDFHCAFHSFCLTYSVMAVCVLQTVRNSSIIYVNIKGGKISVVLFRSVLSYAKIEKDKSYIAEFKWITTCEIQ